VVIHDIDEEEGDEQGGPVGRTGRVKPGRMTFVGRSQEITNEEKLITGLKDHGSRRPSMPEVGPGR